MPDVQRGEMEPDRSRSDRASFPEFFRLQTRWMDIDIYGHLNNTVHYALFDTAVNGWLIENGLLTQRSGDTYGLVVESGCRYHKEILFPSKIEAGLRISKLGSSSVRYDIGLFVESENQAVADGFFVHGNVTRRAHRPVAFSEAARLVLSRLMTEPAS